MMDCLASQGFLTLDGIITSTSLAKKACVSSLKRLFTYGLVDKKHKNSSPYGTVVYWGITCSFSF
ncbi:MAG: hypothetical protein ACFFD4_10725 [Candidatus Odinarchaeota archaeon]